MMGSSAHTHFNPAAGEHAAAPPRRSSAAVDEGDVSGRRRWLLRLTWILLPMVIALASYQLAHRQGRQTLGRLGTEHEPAIRQGEQRLTTLYGEIHRQERSLEEYARERAYLQSRLAQRRQENDALERTLASLSHQVEGLQARVPELEARLAELNAQSTSDEQTLERLTGENLSLKSTRDQLQNAVKQQSTQLEAEQARHRSEVELSRYRGSRP